MCGSGMSGVAESQHAPAPSLTQDVELTQTQVVASSQHSRQREALKDHGVHAQLSSLTEKNVCFQLRQEQLEFEIGRNPRCHVVVADKRASGVHLRIYRDDCFRYYVEEMSPNGCFINKDYVSKGEKRSLQHGDEVSLCVYAHSETEKAFAAWVFTLVMNGVPVCSDGYKGTTVAVSSVPEAMGTASVDAAPDGTSKRVIDLLWVQSQWDLRTLLGSGNFGEVRLGVHVQSGERRAVKVIDKKAFAQFQRKRETRLALQSEAETLMNLNHENIMRVFDWFETDVHLYLVMELLSDGDLLQCIIEGGGCFTEPQARRLFRQLCEAVKYLHDQNVVHRDLKPENILVVGRDRNVMSLKVADFGLAWKNIKSGEHCQTFCGTPHYLSPEVINTFQLRQDGVNGQTVMYGKSVDVWSLGVILYVMLSGVPPFEDEGLYDQIVQAKFEFDVPEWRVVTPDAKALVKDMMTVSPVERLTIQQALDHQWLRFSPPSSPPRVAPLGPDTSHQSDEAMTEAHFAKRRRSDSGYTIGGGGEDFPPCADLAERLRAVAAVAGQEKVVGSLGA
jgi:serine/threonine protein kinase